MNNTKWVLYHKADYDGLMSGAICKFFLEENQYEVMMVPLDYGDPIPEIPIDEMVYLVDLSFPELMGRENLIWIDHHKSAIEQWDSPDIRGIRIDGVAACRLCWQWFAHSEFVHHLGLEEYRSRMVKEPDLVRLLGEYDVWDHRDPDTKTLQLGLQVHDIGIEDLVSLIWRSPSNQRSYLDEWMSDGEVIQKYISSVNRRKVNESSYQLQFEDLNFVVLNQTGGNSLSFEGYEKFDEVDACMLWRYTGGDKITVSLYHKPGGEEHDLSIIARNWGGGGHRGACGFSLKLDSANVCLFNV
jgi:oligoribonuclease NrnB/cAMP/cGMP phosphodiesterase (DHH superfamily)